ncbi:MAG: MarR family transcriptional regulator [Candidatus Ratteibacteria bacterium]
MKKGNKIPSAILQKKVLNIIREKGKISRKEIAEILNVSGAIITKVTDYLIKKGLIYEKEEGKASNEGGRKPVYLEIKQKL